MAPMQDPGMALRFKVIIDGAPVGDLGDWTKCDGLTVEYDVRDYQEGGENDYVHRIPGRIKLQNIKLTRPINSDSKKVAAWIASVQRQPMRYHGVITVFDASGKEVARWAIHGIFPMRWSGPSLDVQGNQIATETLELAHHGFLPAG